MTATRSRPSRLQVLVPCLAALGASAAEFTPVPPRDSLPTAADPELVATPLTHPESAGPSLPLVVSATRLPDAPDHQPYALYQSDRATLDSHNHRTLVDSLNYTPGVYVQHTAPNQASPYIRGLTGEQALILFDGVRLNHALFRPGPNQYLAMLPQESIQRIDTILGSTSAVTGTDGLTGALDFRLAEAGRGVDRPAEFTAGERLSTAEGYSGFGAVDGRVGDVAYTAEADYASYKDLRGGKDADQHLVGSEGQTIPNTAYSQVGTNARTAYTGIEHHRMELAAGYARQNNAPRPDGYAANSGEPGRISRFYEPQEFSYLHLRHAGEFDGPVEHLQTTLWWHAHRENQIREDISSSRYRRREYDDRIQSLGLDVQLTSTPGESHRLTYGATFQHDWTANSYKRYRSPNTDPAGAVLDQTTALNPGGTTVPDDSTYDGIGVFAQDSWQVADRWNLLIGLRYSRFAWEYEATPDRLGFASLSGPTTLDGSAEAVTGNLRVGWDTTDEVYSWAGIGQGFRAPTLSDLAGNQDRGSSTSGGSGTGPQAQGNPDLDAEQSLTIESGVRWRQDRNWIEASVFVTLLRDLIQTVYTDTNNDGIIDDGLISGDSAEVVNAEGGMLWGFEFANDWAIPTGDMLPHDWRLAVVQSASFVRGEVEVPLPSASGDSESQPISRANLLFGRTALRLDLSHSYWGMVQTRWQSRYDDPTDGDATDTRHTTFPAMGEDPGAMPGFLVLDLVVGYRSPGDRLTVTASLENLLDHTYRAVGSGTDGSGLNGVLTMVGRF